MTENAPQPLSAWQHVLETDGAAAALTSLANTFTEEKEFHRLFEVRQMQVRRGLGLAMHQAPRLDELSESQQNELEKGLLDACREVGFLLLDDYQISEAWMYLRAVGDKPQVAQRLRQLPKLALGQTNSDQDNGVEDDHADIIEHAIHIALYEGVDPPWGLSLLLEHRGTCNSITTLSSMFPNLDRPSRSAVAATIVEHLHREVLQNLHNDLKHRELPAANEAAANDDACGPIAQALQQHPVLVADQSHHTDLSHLMSTMQFARGADEERIWRLALDLATYGERLAPQLQTSGDEPFVRYYPMHRAYFAALLKIDAEAHLEKFKERALAVDRDQLGTQAAEIYVDLLARMSRFDQAVAASAELLPPGTATLGIAPSLLELSDQAQDFATHLDLAKSRGDLLAYAQGCLAQHDR